MILGGLGTVSVALADGSVGAVVLGVVDSSRALLGADFPVIVSSFGPPNVPVPAVGAKVKNGLDNGIQHDGSIFRTSSMRDVGFAYATQDDCESIIATSFAEGKGAQYKAASDGTFVWSGNVNIVRPAGQTSLVPELFEDGEGGIKRINGSVTFEGVDFKIVKFGGKIIEDVCETLELA